MNTKKHMQSLLQKNLFKDDFNLSVRALNCLKAADIETVGQLVSFNKLDLLKLRNFGKKSIIELDDLVASLGLTFGMDLSKYGYSIDVRFKDIPTAQEEEKFISETEYFNAMKIVSIYHKQQADQAELALQNAISKSSWSLAALQRKNKRDNIDWNKICSTRDMKPGLDPVQIEHAFILLSERESSIINMYYDKLNPKKLAGIATHFGLSSARVGVLMKKALRQLEYWGSKSYKELHTAIRDKNLQSV